MSKITNVITLKQYATKYKLDAKRIRRLARKNEWPDDGNAPFKFGNIWAIDADAPAVVLPPKSQRGSRRADGRKRHIMYANTAEIAAVVDIVGIDNVIDPRVASKLRRDARKLADTVANDPFAQSKLNALENDGAVLYDVPMTELADGTLVVATENDG